MVRNLSRRCPWRHFSKVCVFLTDHFGVYLSHSIHLSFFSGYNTTLVGTQLPPQMDLCVYGRVIVGDGVASKHVWDLGKGLKKG